MAEIRITFKDNDLEQELFQYLRNTPSPSIFIKTVLMEKMRLDKMVLESNSQLIQQYQMSLMNISANPIQAQPFQGFMQQPMQVPVQQMEQQEQPKQEPMLSADDIADIMQFN